MRPLYQRRGSIEVQTIWLLEASQQRGLMRTATGKSRLRTTAVAVLLVGLVCACSVVSAQDERVADEVPAQWSITGSNWQQYTLRADRAVVLSGSASAVLEAGAEADPARFGALVQGSSAATFKGKRIELSGYIASENAPAGAALWMRADDANGMVVAFENTFPRGIRGTTAWTYQNIVMDIPKEAVALAYGAVLSGHGKLHVDDVQLREVDASVPVTAKPVTPQPHLAHGATSDPGREPRNLDFEETHAL